MTQDSLHALRKPTILVVDDEPANIHVLSEILKKEYRVLFSMSGEDGVRVAEMHKPDLILLDVHMPHIDGFTTCMRLKENPSLRDVPVLFVTTQGALDDEVKGFEVGAVDYITKPIHAATVIKRIQSHLKIKDHWDALQHMIVVDGLTEIANRRGFDIAFDREWRRAVRKNNPFSLIMADIDHFKAYNDHYGHTAGDHCLRAVAKIFDEQMKHTGSLVARYGGEEIVCLLPDTDSAGALQVTKRLQAALEAAAIPHAVSPIASCITLSFGIATAIASAGVEPNELLSLADRLMYQAKTTGKNRFVIGVLQTSAERHSNHSIEQGDSLHHQRYDTPVSNRNAELWQLKGSKEAPTLLIIDDELSQIELLRDILGDSYRILSALSGSDGVRLASSVTPDLILLDVVMPHQNGFEVCQQCKEDPFLKDVPILFVTGRSSVYDEVHGFEVGAVDYVTKPLQPPVVRNRVKNHLELKMQRDVLRHLATTDGLTGIANRRGFDETLVREWLRSVRNCTPISLIMADVDHFKAYNDQYGHLAGDDCLRIVAGVFHRQVQRPGDLVARYGGEEIVCVLPDTDASGALQVTQRLQSSLAACAIPHKASPVSNIITLSFGIATATHDPSEQQSVNAEVSSHQQDVRGLLRQADRYLYEAKNAGRNQIKAGIFTHSTP